MRQLSLAAVLWIAAGTLVLAAIIGGSVATAVLRSQPPPASATAPSVDDVGAFIKRPSADTWLKVHSDFLTSSKPNPDAISALVNLLVAQPLPRNIVDSAVVDLASADWGDAVKSVHSINVLSRTNPTAEGMRRTRRSALIAWLLMSLRASFDTAGVDFSQMDLRGDQPFIGQAMNLQNVDFTNSVLPGGVWRDSDLTDAQFAKTRPASPLSCVRCNWGGLRYDGTLELSNGGWTPG